jgi:pilus assembly protein CpaE
MTDNAENVIRVLIVDDIAETRENIRKLLQFESDVLVVGAARTGVEAIDLARETEPDVVIMDINMPDMDGILATEALLRDVPFAQIVMLSVNNDADYVRRAMRAGARDFLAKPPSGDELISTIRTLAVMAHEQKEKIAAPVPQIMVQGPGGRTFSTGPLRPQGKIIAVYSPKGGVGCTMIATNLAIGLDTADTPAVLVDAALQFGDVAVALNLQAKNTFVDLASRSEELDLVCGCWLRRRGRKWRMRSLPYKYGMSCSSLDASSLMSSSTPVRIWTTLRLPYLILPTCS